VVELLLQNRRGEGAKPRYFIGLGSWLYEFHNSRNTLSRACAQQSLGAGGSKRILAFPRAAVFLTLRDIKAAL